MHPAQRNLKSEQIGPSSHKNSYNIGVLQGNWAEDRTVFDQKLANVPMESTTIHKASFMHPGKPTRQEPTPHGEVDKTLLFGHGDDFSKTSFVTMNELFYTNPFKDGDTKKVDKAIRSQDSSQRCDLAEKKRQQWELERDVNDRFNTTKSSTIDSAAKFARENQVYEPAATRKCHEGTSEFNKDYHKMDLRGPVQMSLSPLLRK
jgi:hypothetical protein